jgi:chorismate synthase
MSIHAVKAVAIGAGFEASSLPGSEVHDEISYDGERKQFSRATNRAGGLEGGVTNGEELRVRGHLKPISTLRARCVQWISTRNKRKRLLSNAPISRLSRQRVLSAKRWWR